MMIIIRKPSPSLWLIKSEHIVVITYILELSVVLNPCNNILIDFCNLGKCDKKMRRIGIHTLETWYRVWKKYHLWRKSIICYVHKQFWILKPPSSSFFIYFLLSCMKCIKTKERSDLWTTPIDIYLCSTYMCSKMITDSIWFDLKHTIHFMQYVNMYRCIYMYILVVHVANCKNHINKLS